MFTPIIDPSTLTEEQREAIKREYNDAKGEVIVGGGKDGTHFRHKVIPWLTSPYLRGRFRMLQDIFGKDFFEKGENHE